MTGRILLLGVMLSVMLGIAGLAGASEARAVPALEPTRLLDRAMPEGQFLPVGSKRHGMHRGFAGAHKGFHGRRFDKGFHGHRFPKRLHGHRFFAGKRLPAGSAFLHQRFVDPGFFLGLRFRHGDVFVKQRFAGPGFLFGHRSGHRTFSLGRPSHHRLHR